ncbi:hypothetical protein HZU77_006515 [Neisseriaceae bacterium TC5R-5]|nr:hypothetical protein [Neisseriaceae bacterium TC5R-5]
MSLLLNSGRWAVALIGLVLWIASLALAWNRGAEQVRQEWVQVSSQQQFEQAQTDLDVYREESRRLHGLSTVLETQLVQLRQTQPKIIERYNRVVEKQALPVDCHLDADRLRELNTAIIAANASIASQSEPSKPSHRAASQR